MNLLNVGANAKTIKSDKSGLGYLTGILYLAPHKTSGYNVCPQASKGCSSVCLFYAGYGRYNAVQEARVKKTKLFFEDREKFHQLLRKDIESLIRKCDKLGVKPAVRLNGTSDIAWHKIFPDLYTDFPQVQYYAYTKVRSRYKEFLDGKLPPNEHLTFSRSENNEDACLDFLRAGGNVAVVFKKELQAKWRRFRVHNGDEHDLRFLDPRGVIGLTAKGRAKHDETGFVLAV